MRMKLLGAILVVCGCGGFGFAMASAHRRQEQMLRQLIRVLEYMSCELGYRMTPLPQLCRNAANVVQGPVQLVFRKLSEELEQQVAPDASMCMNAALAALPGLPESLTGLLRDLGTTLGVFDLPGQLRGMDAAIQTARKTLEALSENRTHRLRSYQTLGLCAGAALAILLL